MSTFSALHEGEIMSRLDRTVDGPIGCPTFELVHAERIAQASPSSSSHAAMRAAISMGRNQSTTKSGGRWPWCCHRPPSP